MGLSMLPISDFIGECIQFCTSSAVNPIQLRQEPNALLLIGIRAGDDGDAGFGIAGVVGKVGHAGRDVDEIAAVDGHVFLQVLTVPHSGLAADDVDGALVTFVQVGPGAFARWDRQQVHAESPGAGAFGGDALTVGKRLLAGEDVLRANQLASLSSPRRHNSSPPEFTTLLIDCLRVLRFHARCVFTARQQKTGQ